MGTPIRLSLIRQHSFMGGDRQLVIGTIFLSILFCWVVTNGFGFIYGLPIGLIIAVAGIWVGREVYKADPYALNVWRRHLKYTRYYAPRGHRNSKLPAIRDFV